MTSEQEKISTYENFRKNVLSHIKSLGYTAIQLMAIKEHSYYASFGYQVTNFFAVSSRFGTPVELKRLIDSAHKHGMLVFLDLIHSHASKNAIDGLNLYNGENNCFFYPGTQGNHIIWDSKIFNLQNVNVLKFLLSNLRY